MSAFFSTLSCCWFWLLLGVLIGWLLNRWLCKCGSNTNHTDHTAATKPDTTSPAKIADISTSAATTPNAVKSAPKPTPKPKVASKPAEKIASSAIAIDITAAKAAGFSIKNANDLTIVEGIGPKINELFNDNGIKTFAELAVKTVPQLRAILDKGGSRYRMANPSTWAKQAALASGNKWAELRKLQDELSGGVKK
jgi:predicted flap endonuclease-1-like 5' DNA nuclease